MVAWSAVIGLYGLLQLFVLGFIRSTVSWHTLMQAVLVGLYTCTVAAYPLELLAVRGLALAGVSNPAAVASYTIDPVIEEVVKAAPLLLLAWRARVTLGIADLILLGAATGLGFRLAEEWLRLTRGIDPGLPSLGALLTWLPSGQQTSLSIAWGEYRFPLAVAGALVWTAIVGLGVGLSRRMPGPAWIRLLVPATALVWVSLDHALVNFSVAQATGSVVPATGYAGPTRALFLFDGFGRLMPYYLLAGLLLALWLDSRRVSRLLKAQPALRLEAPGWPPILGEFKVLVAELRGRRHNFGGLRRFQRVRCQLAYARADGPVPLSQVVARARRELHSPAPISAPPVSFRHSALALLPQAALWIGFLIVFVAGTMPVTSQPWRTQQLLTNPLTPALFLAGAFIAVRNLRRFWRAPVPATLDADVQVSHRLQGLLSVGMAGAIAIGLWAGLSKGLAGFVLSGGAHLYDAAQGTLPATIVTGTAPGSIGTTYRRSGT